MLCSVARSGEGAEVEGTVGRVVVGSTNPVKVNAVHQSFKDMFPGRQWKMLPVSAESGVADQPMGDEETLRGARNRVADAQARQPKADYWCGVEGGCGVDGDELTCFAWVSIADAHGRQGKARSGTFYLPPKVANLVNGGLELGHANDQVFNEHNSKQGSGAVGTLTQNAITRLDFCQQAATMALIPFKNPDLFP